MAPNNSTINVNAPSRLKSAIVALAESRDTAFQSASQSSIGREALRLYLENEAENDRLPEEVLDYLDDDLVANAGGQKGEA